MRLTYTALMVAIMSSGCSAFVASSGKNLNTLTTREQVRIAFGTPEVSGSEDKPFDEFHTHHKISEWWKGEYLIMPGVATFGLTEVVNLPRELFVAARDQIIGQTLRFEYDADGNVVGVLLNGAVPIGCAPPHGNDQRAEESSPQP